MGKRVCLDGAQRELVARHLGLVRLHLRTRVFLPRAATRDRESEDLYREGCLGLMRAAMTYDASRHGEFEPYALARIRGAVHEAIYERFATVRVPLRTIARHRAATRRAGRTDGPGGASDGWVRCSDLGEDVGRICDVESKGAISIGTHGAGPQERDPDTVGCHLRAKLRIALAIAVDRMAGRCRRPGTRPVLEAIAAERLAIPDAQERTALRAISRRFGVSVGRMVAWQRGLEREARGWLAGDREFVMLREAAARSEEGGECVLDASLARELACARAGAFAQGLAGRNADQRAVVLGLVLRHIGKDASQEALRLFGGLPCERQREILAAMGVRTAPSGAEEGPAG